MDDLSGWQAIDIFLFSNGQEDSPPRKYHLTADELELWDATLSYLASSQYGTSQQNSSLNIYTIDGQKLSNPMQLKNGRSYVAVSEHDDFIPAGYQKYMMKATRSWEKRQAKKNPDKDHFAFQTDNHKDYGDVEIPSRREVIINIQNLYNRNEDDFNSLNSKENISGEISLPNKSVDNRPTAEESNTWQEDVEIYKTTKGNNDILNSNKLKRNKVGLISHIKKKENKDAPKGNANLKHKLNNALQSLPIKKFKVAAASKSPTKRQDTSPLKHKVINIKKLPRPSKNEASEKVVNVNDKKSKSSIASDKGAKKPISTTKEIKSVLDEGNVFKCTRRKYLDPEKQEHIVRRNASPNIKFYKGNDKIDIDKNDIQKQTPKVKVNEKDVSRFGKKTFTPAYLTNDKNEPSAVHNDMNKLGISKNVAGINKETKSEIHERFSKADNDFQNKSNTGIILNENDKVNLPLELKSNVSVINDNKINNITLPVEQSPMPVVSNEDIVRILYPKTDSTNTMVQTPVTNEKNITVHVPYEIVEDNHNSPMQFVKPPLDLNRLSNSKITEDIKVSTIDETPFSEHSSNHKVTKAPRSSNIYSNETNDTPSNTSHLTADKRAKTFVDEVSVSNHLSGDKVSSVKRASIKNEKPLGGKIRQYNFQDSDNNKDGVNTVKRQNLAKRTSFGNSTMQSLKPVSNLNQLSDVKTTEDIKITTIGETPFPEHLSGHKGEAPRASNLGNDNVNESFAKYFTDETPTSSHLSADKGTKTVIDEVPILNNLSGDKLPNVIRANIKTDSHLEGKIHQNNFQESGNHEDGVNKNIRQSLAKGTSLNLCDDDINYVDFPRAVANKNDVSVSKNYLDQRYSNDKIRKISQSKQSDADVPYVKSNKSQVTAIVGRGDIFNLKLNLKNSNVEGIITIDKENAKEPTNFVLLDKASQTNLNIIFKDKLLNDIELKPNIQYSSNVVNPELHDETKQIPNIIVFQCTCCGTIDVEKLRKIIPKALPHYNGDLSNKYVVIVPDVDYQNQCQNTQKETFVGPFSNSKNETCDAPQLFDNEGQCYCPPDTQYDFNKEGNYSGIVYIHQCVQTEPSDAIGMSVATSNEDNHKSFAGASTQTSWENTLLIPVLHEDGHCTFRLPPLELIKNI